MKSLDLAMIGNGMIGALVDPNANIVWCCFPRFDGDPLFCSLLSSSEDDTAIGFFAIELLDTVHREQHYLINTPILVTRLTDSSGGLIEITDFAPRFRQYGRMFCPMMMVRNVKRIAGNPRIRVRIRPAQNYGSQPTTVARGSNHVCYATADVALRLTTDASITAVVEENEFSLDGSVTLALGPDETMQGSAGEVGRRFMEETIAYWRGWVRSLAIPFEWQDAVIRAAITLKLNVFEDTGAVIAAVTTSIPEAPNSGRNWDYRYCWLRDAYFVVNALNKLGATRSMQQYLRYILDIVMSAGTGRISPLYGVSGQPVPDEREIDSLDGYRGMGPVRVGNQAHEQIQHDIYGAVILAAPHAFFDQRLIERGDVALFERLEILGARAASLFDQPDSGIWELRNTQRVHTFSSIMCWAGCDRLSKIAQHLGLGEKAAFWNQQAALIRETILRRSWNADLQTFTATMDGDTLDASLLRMTDIGFISADDPRFLSTLSAIEKNLRHGDFIYRYSEPDDFGKPQNAFLVCTFWYINALVAVGRREEARQLFENILACRNGHGLLAEDMDTMTCDQWGNFVQTYSMVGIIDSASRLSLPWDQAY